MPPPKSIFRPSALERLSTPEQLDQLVRVTTPRGWIMLGGVLTLLVVVVLWGFLGSVSTRIRAEGILLGGSVYDVVPLYSGQVTRLHVRVGDTVAQDAVVADVAQPDLMQQIQEARVKLSELQAENRALRAFGAQDIQVQLDVIARQRVTLEQLIRVSEDRLEYLARQVEVEEGLLAQGLITRQQLLSTQQQYEDTRDQFERAGTDLRATSSRELNATFDLEQERSLSTQRVGDAQRLVAQLEVDYAARTRVVSPYQGRVLEVLADEGSLTTPGEPLLKLSVAGQEAGTLQVILYVATEDGKKIHVGMSAQVAPATARPEEYGYMVGTVTRVSDFPATTQGMMHILKNDQLVTQLSAQGAPFEVIVALMPDATTPSRYAWTSGQGPDVPVHSGTPGYSWITTTTLRPVDLVIPSLKKALSLQ